MPSTEVRRIQRRLSRTETSTTEISTAQRFLHLAALSAFALAQPLFDLLSRHVPFLVFHRVDRVELYLLAAGLLILPPAFFLALELAGRTLHPALGKLLGMGTTGLLFGLFAAPILKRMHLERSFLLLPAAALAAAFFVRGYRRSAALRRFLAVLSPAALVFLGVFLASPSVRSLAAPAEAPPDPAAAPPAAARQPPPPSLVFVLFDGLPLVSLLDAEQRIDPVLFPNFAALAAEATWFKNATTNWTYTTAAVATMLTGRSDGAKRPPTLAEHPQNLFTLLAATHEVHATEAVTWMAPAWAAAAADAPSPQEGALLPDLAMVYLAVVSPTDFADWLPDVGEHWGGFRQRDLIHLGDIGDRPTGEIVHQNARGEIVARFIASLAPSTRPRLDYLHSTLPHRPLCFLASGRLYGQRVTLAPHAGELWRPDPWQSLETHQRHLLQVRYVDRLLGDLVTALKQRGLYDASALVVTADHGESFASGYASRLPAQTPHPEDILRIPLLIKAPAQRAGAVSELSVRSVDLLPTVASLLGVEVPWEVEGRSALDPAAIPYLETTIEDSNGARMTFAGDLPFDEESLRDKLERFEPRWGEERLYRIGPFAELVGSGVAELRVDGDAPCTLDLDQKSHLEDHRRSADGYLPARFTGRLGCPALAGREVALAMVVHGRIGAVPEVRLDGGGWGIFSGLVPETWIVEGRNPVAFFLVRGGPPEPRFERVALR